MRFTPFVALVLAAASRFLLIPNGSALLAANTLSGTWFRKPWVQMLLPLALLYASDLVLNNTVYSAYQEGFTWGFADSLGVYAAHLAVLAYAQLAKPKADGLAWIGHSAASNLIFFGLSNLAVWYSGHGVSLGLIYLAGLPFLGISFGATTLWGYAIGFAIERVERTANA